MKVATKRLIIKARLTWAKPSSLSDTPGGLAEGLHEAQALKDYRGPNFAPRRSVKKTA